MLSQQLVENVELHAFPFHEQQVLNIGALLHRVSARREVQPSPDCAPEQLFVVVFHAQPVTLLHVPALAKMKQPGLIAPPPPPPCPGPPEGTTHEPLFIQTQKCVSKQSDCWLSKSEQTTGGSTHLLDELSQLHVMPVLPAVLLTHALALVLSYTQHRISSQKLKSPRHLHGNPEADALVHVALAAKSQQPRSSHKLSKESQTQTCDLFPAVQPVWLPS
ncbi:hypothetical protein HY642_00190 [Candidatus Woesearchaeota archaeon]|nr:hypothetical protein [Candidatus Woesearchaeota archaeon]